MAEYSLERMNELNKGARRSPSSGKLRFGSYSMPKCGRCSKTVYEAEKVPLGGDIVWHKHCLRCCLEKCNRQLSASTFIKVGDEVFCSSHAAEAERRVTHHKLRKPIGPPSPVVRGSSTTPVVDRDTFFRRNSQDSVEQEQEAHSNAVNSNGVAASDASELKDAEDESDSTSESEGSDSGSGSESDEEEGALVDGLEAPGQPEVEDRVEDSNGHASKSSGDTTGESSKSKALLRSNSESDLPPSILKQSDSRRRKSVGDVNGKEKSVTFNLPESEKTRHDYSAPRNSKRSKGSSSHRRAHNGRTYERGSLDDVKQRLAEERALNDQLSRDIEEYDRAVKEIIDEKHQVEQANESLKEMLKQMSQEAEEQSEVGIRMTEELKRAQAELDARPTVESGRTSPSRDTAAQLKISTQEEKIRGLEQELEDLRAEKKVLTDDMTKFANYYTEMEEKCEGLEEELRRAKDGAKKRSGGPDDHDALNRLRGDYDEAIAALEAGKEASDKQEEEIRKLEEEVEEFKSKHRSANEALEGMQAELEHAKQQVPALQEECQELSAKLSERDEELKNALTLHSIADSKSLESTQEEISELHKLLSATQEQAESLSKTNLELQANLQSTEEELEAAECVKETLTAEVERLRAEISEVSEAAVQAEEGSKTTLVELQTNLKALEEEAKASKASLEEQIKSLQVEKEELVQSNLEHSERLMKALEDATSRMVAETHSSQQGKGSAKQDEEEPAETQTASSRSLEPESDAAKEPTNTPETPVFADSVGSPQNEEVEEVAPELVNEFMENLCATVKFTLKERRVLKAALLNQNQVLTAAAEHWNDTGDESKLVKAVGARVRANDLMALVKEQEIDTAMDQVCEKVPLNDDLIDALENAILEQNSNVLGAMENWALTLHSGNLVKAISAFASGEGNEEAGGEVAKTTEEKGSAVKSPGKKNEAKGRKDHDTLLSQISRECKLSDAETNILGKAFSQDNAVVVKALQLYDGPQTAKLIKDAIAQINQDAKRKPDTPGSKRSLRRKSPSSSSTPSSTRSGGSHASRTKLNSTRRPLSASSLRNRGGRPKSRSRSRRRSRSDSSDGGEGGMGPMTMILLCIILVIIYLSVSV